MTIKEIAHISNVSISTVSKVLNKKGGVGKEKQTEIENLLIKYNLYTKKTKKIAVIVPDLANPFFADILKEISKDLIKKNAYITIFDSDENIENENIITTMVTNDDSIDAVILAVAGNSKNNLKKISLSKKPVILLDRELDFYHCGVFLDDFKAGYLAGKKLINLGHKKIAVISANQELKNIKNRLDGFFYALKEYGLSLLEKNLITENLKFDGGYRAMENIYNNLDVSAILILNNMMTLGAIDFAYEKNIKSDYYIMGFDLPKYSKISDNIANITRSSEEMGLAVSDLILEKINEKSNIIKKVIIEPKIISN